MTKLQIKIQGLYEILGYLLTSGNKEEILFILVGKKGGGKSVLGQIITALVGELKTLVILS